MKPTKKDYNNKLEQLKRGLTFFDDCKEIAYDFKVWKRGLLLRKKLWKKEEEKFNYTHELPEEIKGGKIDRKIIEKL